MHAFQYVTIIFMSKQMFYLRGAKSAEFYEDISDPNRPYPGIIGV